jgi:hypothetical protein
MDGIEREVRNMGKLLQLDAQISRLVQERDMAIKAFEVAAEKALDIAALQVEANAEAKRFALALSFYANPANYDHIPSFPYPTVAIYLDHGERAIEALDV